MRRFGMAHHHRHTYLLLGHRQAGTGDGRHIYDLLYGPVRHRFSYGYLEIIR
nr:MAG TPA: YcgJ protein [Caudoviricetes sp.]